MNISNDNKLNNSQLSNIVGGKMTARGLRDAIVGGAVGGGFMGVEGGPGGVFLGAHLGATAGAIQYAFQNW